MGNKSKRKRQAQDVDPSDPPAKRLQKVEVSRGTREVREQPSRHFLDEPKGVELKREVELYEQLSSQDASERLQAADAVVSGLLAEDGVSEPALQRHLERRLFRGLASGRKAARLGFSVVLTEILSQLLGTKQLSTNKYPTLTFEKVLDILKTKTKPEGDLSGQEERDHALGLLFGLQCFVRSKTLSEDGGNRWDKILESLLHLAKKKPWIREECGWVIVEALEQISRSETEKTVTMIQDAGLAASPEGVGIWLTARRVFPGMKFPTKPWGNGGNPLENLQSLSKALKESSSPNKDSKEEKVKQKGSWNPQLHFVWDIVISEYMKSIELGVDGSIPQFDHFWKIAVDDTLFSSSASSERKFWGFLLFQKLLKEAPRLPGLLEPLFSQNLMRCLVNHVSKEDRFLHRAAEKSLKAIQQVIEEMPGSAGVVIKKLLTGTGTYNFDHVTKTKTIEKLLHQVPNDTAPLIISDLLAEVKVVKTADAEKDAESRRQIFADYVFCMIRNIKVVDTRTADPWVISAALPALASLAYSQDDSFQPAVSQKTRNIFRARLSSAFAHLVSAPDSFLYVHELLKGFEPSAVDMDEEVSATKDKALADMEKIATKAQEVEDRRKKPLQAVTLLYGFAIFQLYNADADAVSLLEELNSCYDVMMQETGEENSPVLSVVLVEILLSFIAKPSMLLRKTAQLVVMAFSGEITEEGITALIEVLESSESLRGQQELFDQDDEVEDEEDGEDGLDSDVEMVDTNGDGLDDESGSDSEEEDMEDEKEAVDDDDEATRMLDDALAKAVGTHRADQDLNEAPSDSDADMSDSEMIALDAKLVEIFSQRKKQPSKKQEKMEARENIINFKTRVLDLLEIYVKEQSGNEAAFKLLLPLLNLMRTTTAKHLSEKAHRVITVFAKASKSTKIIDDGEADVSFRIDILKDLHKEASKNPSHAFAKAASTASLMLASNLYRSDMNSVKKIATVYRDTQVKWMKGELKMQASFFHDWVNWCQSHVS